MTATAIPPGTAEASRWYALNAPRLGPNVLAELHELELTMTRCALCEETFEGSFADGRAWFAEHRASAHAELGEPQKRSRRAPARS